MGLWNCIKMVICFLMLSERGFVFRQDSEECGCACVCAPTSVFWRVTRCKVSTRIMLAFPEEELVKAWSLAEPCRWCCGLSLPVSVLENSPATGFPLCGEHGKMLRELGSTEGFSVDAAATWGFNLYSCGSKTELWCGARGEAGRGPRGCDAGLGL